MSPGARVTRGTKISPGARRKVDRYDVDPPAATPANAVDVALRKLQQAALLARIDALLRTAEAPAATGTHLDHDQPLAVAGNHVQLAAAGTPVAGQDRPAEAGEVLGGQVLAAPAQGLAIIHRNTVPLGARERDLMSPSSPAASPGAAR
jgi:hypothetical protein